jgi:hypothetical protein
LASDCIVSQGLVFWFLFGIVIIDPLVHVLICIIHATHIIHIPYKQ